MALILIEGFDHYSADNRGSLWTRGSANVDVDTDGGRWGTNSGALNFLGTPGSSDYADFSLMGNFQDIILGFAYKPSGGGLSDSILADFRSQASTTQMMLRIGSAGTMWITRGSSTTIVASGSTVLPTDHWSYIEVHLAVADSGGRMEVRVNGNPTPDIDYTGDTRSDTTYASTNFIRMRTGYRFNSWIDDLYILDKLNAPNDDFLGDCRVDTFYANGDGSHTDWTPSAGSNYSCVDERPVNTTDYVETNSAAAKDLYTLGNMSQATDVLGVQISAFALKTDAGTYNIRVGCKTGGKEYWSNDKGLSIDWDHYKKLFEVNPYTHAAWTKAQVDTLEAGVQFVTDLTTTAPPTTAAP